MATVRVPTENRVLTEEAAVRARLRRGRHRFERWAPAHPVAEDAPAEEVLAAYAREIEVLKEDGGYVTADVIDVKPDTPGLDAMLAKFRREHWHDEDEVRFIIKGRGSSTSIRGRARCSRSRWGPATCSACRAGPGTGSTSAPTVASARSASSRTPRAGHRTTRRAGPRPASSRSAWAPRSSAAPREHVLTSGRQPCGSRSWTSRARPLRSASSTTSSFRTRASGCRRTCAPTPPTPKSGRRSRPSAASMRRSRESRAPPPWRDDDPAEAYACWLIDRDRKSTPLKSLQGRIWEDGLSRRPDHGSGIRRRAQGPRPLDEERACGGDLLLGQRARPAAALRAHHRRRPHGLPLRLLRHHHRPQARARELRAHRGCAGPGARPRCSSCRTCRPSWTRRARPGCSVRSAYGHPSRSRGQPFTPSSTASTSCRSLPALPVGVRGITVQLRS